jgi:hypothetical protein
MGGEFLAQTSGSESGVTEHDVTLLVPGDIESVRRRLPEALERFGYRVLSEQPLQARRKAQGWGRGSNHVLDQRTTVLINSKPSGKRATRVTFDYTVDHPWLTRGDLQTLEREGEAIVALAKLRVESSTCPECGTEAIADSRFCRQCGTPLAKSQPSEIEVFRVTAGARAGYQNIVGGAILLVVSCLSLLPLPFTEAAKLESVWIWISGLSGALGWFGMLGGMRRLHRTLNPKEEKKEFHLCKWRFIGDVPFQYRERGLGGPPMLGSPLAPARGTELLAHLHRSISVPPAVASGAWAVRRC